MFQKDSIKNSLSLKLFIVGFLIAILMIPTGMIALLVNERESRQQEAFFEISEKWGQAQFITGPVLTVPYSKIVESTINGEKIQERQVRYAHFLPEVLNISGEVNPETRKSVASVPSLISPRRTNGNAVRAEALAPAIIVQAYDPLPPIHSPP